MGLKFTLGPALRGAAPLGFGLDRADYNFEIDVGRIFRYGYSIRTGGDRTGGDRD